LQVRGPDDVDAGVQQVDVQAFDLLGFCQRQCYVEAANAMGRYQVAQVGEATQDRIKTVARYRQIVRSHKTCQWFFFLPNQLVREIEG